MQGPLYRVEGGNAEIPSKLAKSADKVVRSHVQAIDVMALNKFRVLLEDNSTLYFDYVILAAPLYNQSKYPIEFRNFPPYFNLEQWVGMYRRTIATLIAGDLNNTFFGSSSKLDTVYDVDSRNSVVSISRLQDIFQKSDSGAVWKVFSSEPLTDEQLQLFFVSVRDKKQFDWFAYPDYSQPPAQVPPFILHGNLFYLNGIEWIASAMEMSLIAAKNIAIAIESILTGKQPECPSQFRRAPDDL